MKDSLIGEILNGKYEIEQRLGSGGMGTVYLAHQIDELDRPVAIKIIRSYDAGPTKEEIDAFIREARTLANLRHPRILKVYELAKTPEPDSIIFLVMEPASGGSLHSYLYPEKGPSSKLTEVEAGRILFQVAEALDHAHKQRIVHLDIKPHNILFLDEARENVVVADFGLARLLRTSLHAQMSKGAGTLVYMPPEQAIGAEVEPRTDVFALGVTLHEMLTLKVPDRSVDRSTLKVKLLLDQGLPPAIQAAIERATQHESHLRYSTAGELARDFLQAIQPKTTIVPVVLPIPPSASEEVFKLPPPSPLPLPPLSTPDLTRLLAAMREIGDYCEEHPNLNERELVTYAFKSGGLFAALDYEEPGKDALLEYQHMDVVLRAINGRALAVIEFKNPQLPPDEGLDQLKRYTKEWLPDAGVLCNGREIWLYKRTGEHLYWPPVRIRLKDANDKDADVLYTWLGKRQPDFSKLEDFETILRSLTAHPIAVGGPNEIGGKEFLNRFALNPRTPFGRLVAAMAEALPAMIQASNFTRGAYDFWKRIYARELTLSDAPKSWKPLMPGGRTDKEAMYQLMFALESAYAVLSRLLLARAMENHHFPDLELTETLLATLRPLRKGRRLPLDAYATALKEVFGYAGLQAFQSLFDSDIFDWWHDINKAGDAVLPVGKRLAEAILAVFEFDFQPMTGDLLGSLYQSYFDTETRKALGEFYTPPEVVNFILDEVGYKQDHDPMLRNKRLLDPACGSGTFLVRALQRYLAATKGQKAKKVLEDLLGGLKIVGFDINPFAVLMAQINYAAQIIPLYAEALQSGELPSTLSIPVLRTDSLRQEYREGEASAGRSGEKVQLVLLSVSQNEDVTLIHTELPVEDESGAFVSTDIPVPRYKKAHELGWISNAEKYFAALRVLFDAVADRNSQINHLRERLIRAGFEKYAHELASYMQPAAKQLVDEMRRLRERFDDGRFLKTLADLALALILKNDVEYDYVVGNPPYIRIQTIPPMVREKWEAWYQWADGNFDSYIPFLERAIYIERQQNGPNWHEWLGRGGKLGYICPNRFLLANYAEGLRRELPKRAAIELLLDLRDSRVFKDALNYPAILIMHRLQEGEEAPANFPAIRVFADPRQGAEQLLTEARQLMSELQGGKEYHRGQIADAFPVNSSSLLSSAWLLMPAKERQVFEKLETAATVFDVNICPICNGKTFLNQETHQHTIRLESLTATQSGAFQGIATGDDPALIFRLVQDRGERLLVRPKGAGEPDWEGPKENIEIEREIVRPWLFGRDIARWHIAWDGWYVFFPYAKIEALERRGKTWIPITRYRLIPTTETAETFRKYHHYQGDFPLLDQKYPCAWRYLSQQAIAKRLRGRENGRRAIGTREAHQWYDLGRPQNLEQFNLPKLLMQVSSPDPDFAFDEDRHFLLQHGGRGGGTDGIVLKPIANNWLILALLNSAPLDYYLKHVSVVFGGNTYSYSDAFIKQLPIKLPLTEADRQQAQAIMSLARQLTSQKEELLAKERERDSFPEPQGKRLLSRYDLDSLSQFVEDGRQAQTFNRDKVNFGQPTLEGKPAMKFGKGSIIFPHQEMADVVKAWIELQPQADLRVDDLLSIQVPGEAAACKELLEMLDKLKAEIVVLSSQLAITDGIPRKQQGELDDLVADYYGLDVTERSIMADFLGRF